MFIGIIETTGIIRTIEHEGSNFIFWIESPISRDLKTGDSVSHNGVCLSIEEVENSRHRVTAIEETLSKTNLRFLKVGDEVNLERSLPATGRIEGHFVQGHVDCTGIVYRFRSRNGSMEFQILYPQKFKNYIIPRGSISIDGISLTISNLLDEPVMAEDLLEKMPQIPRDMYNDENFFSFFVNIIPHTYKVTNIKNWQKGSLVNIEFDVLGKYINRLYSTEIR